MNQLLKQCRTPKGLLGEWIAWGMNRSHSKLTAWGLRHVPIEKHYTILDVGCGGGATVHKLALIAVEGKVYGIDLSEMSVAVSRRTNRKLIQAGRVEIELGSVSCLPFPDNKFDLVTAVETHFFWPDLISDMREIQRVLKPNGNLIIISGVNKGGKHEERNREWVELGKMAYHSMNELGMLISTAGFSTIQLFEEYEQGWVCCVGTKPLASS